MYKDLSRSDINLIKRSLKQYVKKNSSIYSDDYHDSKRIIKELNAPSKDSEIHAEIVDFMLKGLMEKYSFIDNEGNIVRY